MHLDRTTARHGLPHPLAVLYDRLNQPDPWRRLEDLFAFTEGVARYLAWVLTAEAAARGAPTGRLRSDMKATSFGAFLHVISGALKARVGQTHRFLPELNALPDSAAMAFLDRANQTRNAAMHHRVARDTRAANDLLREFEPGFQALLDGIAFLSHHPLGVLRGAQVEHDGAVSAHWLACRGPSMRSGNTRVRDADAVPSDQLLLLDLEARLALTLSPFFLCDEHAFYWMDLPREDDASRASAYVRPAPGDPMPTWLPKHLFDATRSAPNGLSLAQWLADSRQRPRIVPLRFDVDSCARVRSATVPTQTGSGFMQPAAVILLGGHDAPPRSAALAISATPSLPSPAATPTPPAWSTPPPAASAALAPSSQPPSTPSAPSPPTSPTPPPASPSLPTHGLVTRASLPARASSRAGIALAGVVTLILAGGVTALATRTRGNPSVDEPPAASPVAPVSSEPARPNARPSPDRPLAEHPQLRAWLLRWAAAATDNTFVDPVTGQTFAPEPVGGFYAPTVSYHNVRGVTPSTIATRWAERHAHNRFTVNFTGGVWLPEEPQRLSDGCKRSPGTGPVLLVSLGAVEAGDAVVRPRRGATCPRVAGPYLLQVKQIDGNWRVCMETWHDARAVCASCPQMCVNGSSR